MTEEQLKNIESRANAATPVILDCGDNSCLFIEHQRQGGMRTNGGCRCYENAGFSRSSISSAVQMLKELKYTRTDVPALVEEVRRLKTVHKENLDLRTQIDTLQECLANVSSNRDHWRTLEMNANFKGMEYQAKCQELATTLQKIADQDFRGNRSTESRLAYEALKKYRGEK